LDVCHVDEAGFAPTLPTCYSWSAVGERLNVPYEAPQGRRVNAIGAYFSHGPCAGDFEFATAARLPESRPPKSNRARKTLAERAAGHGLEPEEVGVIDSDRFLAFVWQVAGRPTVASSDWRRERPVVFVIDNYTVHTSERVQAEMVAFAAADIHFFYLPSYSPELSRIEPIWLAVKHHELTQRSHAQLGGLKRAVDEGLARKAAALRAARSTTDESLRLAA